MDYDVIQRDDIFLIGIECRTSNNPGEGEVAIPELWGRFFGEGVIGRIPGKISDEVFALYCDYEGDHTDPYTVVIGSPVDSLEDIPDGMVGKVIPASAYARHRAIGRHPEALIATWGKIWNSELPRTYTGDFEVYGKKFNQDPQEVEVYIAIDEL